MRFAARTLCICVLAWLTVGAAPAAPPPAALLAHMRAVNDRLYETRIDSTAPRQIGAEEPPVRSSAQGVTFSLQQCTQSVCLGTFFDGERLYSVNINGTILPRSEATEPGLRALRLVATETFLAPGFTQGGGTIDDDGYGSFNGRRYRKIIVADELSVPMVVYIDPQTGLIAGARDVNGNAIYAMRDYRKVGRFMLPFQIDRNGEVLEAYASRSVSDAPLSRPRGVVGTVTGAAPMRLDPSSTTPMGTCTIGGIAVHCLIDSGNSAMSMSLELAERLGLTPVGMLRVAGLGDYATEVVRAGPLSLGPAQFSDLNYIVLNDINRYGYDVIVGADVLASMPVTIDNTRHELYFGGETPADIAGTTIAMQFQNFVPVVNVTLGSRPTALAIDTGDQSNINLAYDYYVRHPELFKATRTESVSGVGGSSVELIGEIASVRIGTLTAQNQQIGTTKTLKGTADGHLGAAFLSQYRIVLDYAHQLMRLYPLKPL